MRRLFLLGMIGMALACFGQGRIERLGFWSPEMRDSVKVDVWVPEVYLERENVRLPVLYMHDGQNLYDPNTTWNHQSWEVDSVASKLIAEGRMEPVIVVGVHSVPKSRIADLMPQAVFKDPEMKEALAGILDTPLRGDAYAAFMSHTLRDSINSSYRTLTDCDNTAVMGSSMGGLMSLYMMCEYPEIYGKAGCLSTHWTGDVNAYARGDERFPAAMYEYVKGKLPRDGKHKIYFDRGTTTIDADYWKWNDRVISLCEELGYGTGTIETFVDEGASHEEKSWMKRVWRPLVFLFPAK